MHRRVVLCELVEEHDLNHVADLGSNARSLRALPWRLRRVRTEAAIGILAIEGFEPRGAPVEVVRLFCAGRVFHRDLCCGLEETRASSTFDTHPEPIVPSRRGIVPFDFLCRDVVLSHGSREVEARGGEGGQFPIHQCCTFRGWCNGGRCCCRGWQASSQQWISSENEKTKVREHLGNCACTWDVKVNEGRWR